MLINTCLQLNIFAIKIMNTANAFLEELILAPALSGIFFFWVGEQDDLLPSQNLCCSI